MNTICGICGRPKKRNRNGYLGCPHCDDSSDFIGKGKRGILNPDLDEIEITTAQGSEDHINDEEDQ